MDKRNAGAGNRRRNHGEDSLDHVFDCLQLQNDLDLEDGLD